MALLCRLTALFSLPSSSLPCDLCPNVHGDEKPAPPRCPLLLLLLTTGRLHDTAATNAGGRHHQKAMWSCSRGRAAFALVPPRVVHMSPRASVLRAQRKTITSTGATTTTWMSKEGDFISKQKQASISGTKDLITRETKFVKHQKQVFDKMAETFASGETISDDLVPVYQQLAQRILSHAAPPANQKDQQEVEEVRTAGEKEPPPPMTIKVLDVACGTGALWPFLADAAWAAARRLDVTGVDLSTHMVERAAAHADALFEEHLYGSSSNKPRHSFAVIESDVLEYTAASGGQEGYDLVVANACFGNFWDPAVVTSHLEGLLRLGGSLVVTHPLGSSFVEKLHREDPNTVRHLLPMTQKAWVDLTLTQPLQLTELVDPLIEGESGTPFYLAALKKVRARALSEIMRFRGTVDTGYGRGGKKLGFPTANLPCRLFRDALQDVTNGVYFGWAVLEGETQGRKTPHRAVVNVGYSPTFEGKENPEKIVEAHLIFEEDANPLDPPDFYGEAMRLQLIGFLRPEIKVVDPKAWFLACKAHRFCLCVCPY